ncbi:MAG TPA: prolyl oligopeptidase family serine peptidase [Kofleriaceae bacterium]|nr:prolyl oligopeptidase family serine peptidase [Kofleriaceae bacterium]
MRKLLPIMVAACGGATQSAQVPVDPPAHPVAQAPEKAPEVAMPPVQHPHPWPTTRVATANDTLHGQTIHDPYRWLEDENSPEVQAWMTAQDGYARGQLGQSPHRDDWVARLKQVFYYDAITAPIHRGGRYFYARKHADKEKTIIYWKQGEAGAEQVLFDPNQWSADGSKGLGVTSASWDGRYVAYGVKEHNSDESVLHIRDVTTGKDLAETIEGAKYANPSWTPDNHGFYYTWVPAVGDKVTIADRPGFAEIRYHKLGAPVAGDPVIHAATGNPGTFIAAELSRDGPWLLVAIQHGWNSTDLYFKDTRKHAPGWTALVEGVDATFELTAWRDQFYVMTNDGAPKNRVYKVDPAHLERSETGGGDPDGSAGGAGGRAPRGINRAAWKEIVPESDATLEHAGVVGEHLVLTYLRHAANEIEIHDLAGKLVHKVDLPPLGSAGGIVGNPDEDTGYIGYTSFTEPQVIYKASIHTGKTAEWARIKLPVDTAQLTAEQVFYPSKDGTKISMFILSKQGTVRDAARPTILTGYGGFNVSMTPVFASSRAVWLERGGVIAIPNLRGGGEYGEGWHRAGMQLVKQNVFDDFIAAAEYLIAERWTSRDHLAISGGSNGGLLVGAAVTQRPDLFKAVICAVPLLDMLRYHLFGSGKTWVPEYGSAEDEAQFKALYHYSPYRVAVDAGARAYPAVLFDSADHDDRVDPMHARKLAAMMQGAQTGDAPILLRIERNSGHGGADLVKQQVERSADQMAWLESLLR